MNRKIIGFDAGDWVADLKCGHTQHVRHRPPFQRPWLITPAGRRSQTGTELACKKCDVEGTPWRPVEKSILAQTVFRRARLGSAEQNGLRLLRLKKLALYLPSFWWPKRKFQLRFQGGSEFRCPESPIDG
jgi:hypothetical protein